MARVTILILFPSIIFFTCVGKRNFDPNQNLSSEDQKKFIQQIIRLTARTPESLGKGDRFDPQYDSFYNEQASKHIMEAYFKKGNREYFMLTRPAPSLFEKRVAIGGYIVFGRDGAIDDYEEKFRTWKMVPDTLRRRSLFLFEKMVDGESLKPWETINTNGIEYIEFPDERTYFDRYTRTWRVR